MSYNAAIVALEWRLRRYEHVEQIQDARVKQIALLLVLQEYLDDLIEQIFLNHVEDAVGVFGQDDCLEELDYLDIGLAWLEPLAVSYFLHDFITNEESSDLVGIHIVLYQFVQELEDQDSTVVKLFLELKLHGLIYWRLYLFLFRPHFLVFLGLSALVWLFNVVFFLVFWWIAYVRIFIWNFEIVFCNEPKELSDNFIQYYCLECLLHLGRLLAD